MHLRRLSCAFAKDKGQTSCMQNFKVLASLCSWKGYFELNMVIKHKDVFCRFTVHMIWPPSRESLSSRLTHIKAADQPAHSRSLISVFAIRFSFLRYYILICYQRNFDFLAIVTVCEQAGSGMTWSEIPYTRFLALRPM